MSTKMPPLPMPPLPKIPAPNLPPLPAIPALVMPPLPVTPVLTGMTAEFMKNPLQFMRTHCVSPPHDSGQTSGWTADHGAVSSQVNVPGSTFKTGGKSGLVDATLERRTGAGGIRHFQVVDNPGGNFPGAATLKIAPADFVQNGTYIPVHWLPWKNLKIISFTIPAVPHSLAEWDDEEYPRFFFTAGINGCSVFAHGSPEGPTIAHAGLELNLKESSTTFWRRMMQQTNSGYSAAAIQGEIHSSDYMAKSPQHIKLMENYRKFLSGGIKDFKLEVQSPFGCVFGIRYGRSWTLYLQKSVVYSKTRFYKTGDLDFRPQPNPKLPPRAYLKDTTVFVESRTEKKIFGKDVQVYSVTERFSKPIQVMEMFPNKSFVAELKDVVTAI